MKGKLTLILGTIGATNLVLVFGLGYVMFAMKDTLTDRIARIESSAQEQTQEQLSDNESKMAEIASQLELIKQHMGVTSADLKNARETAQAVKRQQERAAKELAKQIAAKANSAEVDGLRQETTTKIAEVQQDSTTRIGSVYGEVTGLKKDLVDTREDWQRRLVDATNGLSDRIARNSSEVAELRKKGDRDYFEFDIRKNSKQPFNRVADVQLSLLKTDPKKHKYNVAILADDQRLERTDKLTNEPVQFLVGRDQLRYEVVVNIVEKDHIRGYVSTPKGKALAAEIPQFRVQ
jgi:hypothetical protein